MKKNEITCVETIKEKQVACKKIDCRYNLKSDKSLSCAMIAAEEGPLTLQEIGDFYGISRMRVCQIERAILKKIREQQGILKEFDPSS